MENYPIIVRIRNEIRSFFEAAGNTNEIVYFALLTLYVGIFYFLKIQWIDELNSITEVIRYGLLSILMWGSALYLIYVIAEWKKLWKKTIPLILIVAVILYATYVFTRRMSTNLYGVVMDVFFCIMVYKKDYKKILRCMLGVSVVMLLVAGLGLVIGLTADVGKPETSLPGHSLGINYPNSWGYLVFLGLIICWYLYLRFKPVITCVIFWAVSVFMYNYIICRTIAGITLVFPILAFLVDRTERIIDKKIELGKFKRIKAVEWFLIVIPFIAWAFMMFSSFQVDWWYQYYHGALRNLAWRFIQGGLYFHKYGVPLVGNPYNANQFTYINVQNEFIKVGILDSSFAAYIIMRGIIWLCCTLLWLCVAHWKALKKRDYAIILIETIFLGFAMMERPGLEMWYNFILLYPLAKVTSKENTEKVLEFDGPVSEVVNSANVKLIKGYLKDYKSFMQLDVFPAYKLRKLENSVETKEGEKTPHLVVSQYDIETGHQFLMIPEDMCNRKDLFFREFTHILDNGQFVKKDKETSDLSAGFMEYHASQVQLASLIGLTSASDNITVSMQDSLEYGITVLEFMNEAYETTKQLYLDSEFETNTEISSEAIKALYRFLGFRSVCELYVKDFDRSIYDSTFTEEKLGTVLFNKIDNHMHGWADRILFNLCKDDYKELSERFDLTVK